MLWGEITDEKAKVDASTSHFDEYYKAFSRFYSALLFTSFVTKLGSVINIGGETLDVADSIARSLESWGRWPELVTYEELNDPRLQGEGFKGSRFETDCCPRPTRLVAH